MADDKHTMLVFDFNKVKIIGKTKLK